VLGEQFSIRVLFGGALICAAVLLVAAGEKKTH